MVPLCSNLRDRGHSSHISRSAPLPNPQLSAPADKDRADEKRAQIRCQGRNPYLETIFKILAKKTKLGARQVSHGAPWLSLPTAVGSHRGSKPELPAQAGDVQQGPVRPGTLGLPSTAHCRRHQRWPSPLGISLTLHKSGKSRMNLAPWRPRRLRKQEEEENSNNHSSQSTLSVSPFRLKDPLAGWL